jgi:hypothetical protein
MSRNVTLTFLFDYGTLFLTAQHFQGSPSSYSNCFSFLVYRRKFCLFLRILYRDSLDVNKRKKDPDPEMTGSDYYAKKKTRSDRRSGTHHL